MTAKIVVTGAAGRLGRALVAGGGAAVVGLDRAALDITDRQAVDAALDALRPAAVINAAAMTAVDRAEHDRDAAFAVNAAGAAGLAAACAARGIALVHVSTDHVFDGRAERPYREDDPTGPPNVYGASKLAGEQAVLAAGGTVVRTSWLFGGAGDPHGFVAEIARAARRGIPLRVTDDQHGCPTFAGDLADALLVLARDPPGGVWHYAGEGATTRHGFACRIVESLGLAVEVTPVATAEHAAAAARPRYAVLDTTRIRALGITPRPWRDQFLSR